jgi:hypothetical protein
MDNKVEIRPNAVYTLPEVCPIVRINDATARRHLKNGRLRATHAARPYPARGSQLLTALEETPSVRSCLAEDQRSELGRAHRPAPHNMRGSWCPR